MCLTIDTGCGAKIDLNPEIPLILQLNNVKIPPPVLSSDKL